MSSSDQAENCLQDLYDNAPRGYLTLGPDGRIIRVNIVRGLARVQPLNSSERSAA